MILCKITSGYVVQSFDTEKNQWVSQEFIASSVTDYEDESGRPLLDIEQQLIEDEYLPFCMKQP